jgi:hypothetical protein
LQADRSRQDFDRRAQARLSFVRAAQQPEQFTEIGAGEAPSDASIGRPAT